MNDHDHSIGDVLDEAIEVLTCLARLATQTSQASGPWGHDRA